MGMALNLSDADTSGDFTVLPSGTYGASVSNAAMEETKNAGKLPAGTPMINLEFTITDENEVTVEVDGKTKTFSPQGRKVWKRLIIAPDKVGGKKYEHKDKMDGILVRSLTALGYDQEEVMSGSFNLDLEDLPGRACRVTVKMRQREDNGELTNDVVGIKPAMAESGLL